VLLAPAVLPAPAPDCCAQATATANIALANKHIPHVTFFIVLSFGHSAG
jgi:hypothetical protein